MGETRSDVGNEIGRLTAVEGYLGGEMRKRSVVIAGHRTSVSLETAFWTGLKEIAGQRGMSVNRLVETLDSGRGSNLSSAIRVFVLQHYRGPEKRMMVGTHAA